MTKSGAIEDEGDTRIWLDIVREAGDWAMLEPVEALATAAAVAVAQLSHSPAADLVAGSTASPRTRGNRSRRISRPHRQLDVCLVLADDDTVRALNRDYRGKDKPTNVLSFPAPAAPRRAAGYDGPCFLGDIVIAAETLAREAADDGIAPAHHFQHLVIHGLLHLLGHDHETDVEAVVMEALEVRALASLGVPSPYLGREPVMDA